jgi:hypothetical protein
MHTCEEFTYDDKTYIIYLDVNGGDTILTMSKSQCGGIAVGGKTYIKYVKRNAVPNQVQWVSMSDWLISPEIDDAIMTYMEHNGFAGLTPVEYLTSLGLIK